MIFNRIRIMTAKKNSVMVVTVLYNHPVTLCHIGKCICHEISIPDVHHATIPAVHHDSVLLPRPVSFPQRTLNMLALQ